MKVVWWVLALVCISLPLSAQVRVRLRVFPNPISLTVGDTFRLNGGIYDPQNRRLNINGTWVSTNTHIMTVSSTGLVKAVGVGVANAELHVGKLLAWSTATVAQDRKIASLQIIAPTDVASGTSAPIRFIARNKAGVVLTGKRVNCVSSDTTVLRITQKCDTTVAP